MSEAALFKTPELRSFQVGYPIDSLQALAISCLQSPYLYALYSACKVGKKGIGQMIIAGFGLSAVSGAFVSVVFSERRKGCPSESPAAVLVLFRFFVFSFYSLG